MDPTKCSVNQQTDPTCQPVFRNYVIIGYLCNTHRFSYTICDQGECLINTDFDNNSTKCRTHSLSSASYDMLKAIILGNIPTTITTLTTNQTNLTTLVNSIKTQHNKLITKLKDSSLLGISTGITALNYTDYLVP